MLFDQEGGKVSHRIYTEEQIIGTFNGKTFSKKAKGLFGKNFQDYLGRFTKGGYFLLGRIGHTRRLRLKGWGIQVFSALRAPLVGGHLGLFNLEQDLVG